MVITGIKAGGADVLSKGLNWENRESNPMFIVRTMNRLLGLIVGFTLILPLLAIKEGALYIKLLTTDDNYIIFRITLGLFPL